MSKGQADEPRGSEPRYPYVHVDVPRSDSEGISDELFEWGATGIEERDGDTLLGPEGHGGVTLVASFEEESVARNVVEALGSRHPTRLAFVVGDAWRDTWKEYFKAARVGARLLVRPSWEPVVPQAGEVVLTIDPDRAFGSGTHETTRLVLREVDRYVRGGERILDVGCGSGILSVASLLLGAARARAVDIDPDAVAVTRETARKNRVASRVDASDTPVHKLRSTYGMVLANIQADVLVDMAASLGARVAPGGRLILSGILREQRDEVRNAYRAFDEEGPVRREGEWIAWVLRKRGKAAP